MYKRDIRSNLFTGIGFNIFLFICLYFVIFYNKVDGLLFLNEGIHPKYDLIFKLITNIGDEKFWILIMLFISIFSFRKAFLMGVAGVFTAIITFIIKYSVPNNFRPVKYFQENNLDLDLLNLVEGFTNKMLLSFPSGHASMAFCTFTMLAFFVNNKYLKLLLIVSVIVICFSRVFLYQHFVKDILIGGIIGFICSVFVFLFIKNIILIKESKFLDKSLTSFIKK